jgi:predicted ferric reductase
MSTSSTIPPTSSPREATSLDAVLSGVGVAAGILIALALTGNLGLASGTISALLIDIGRGLGAPPPLDSQVYWHMARAAGVAAYLLLWASVALGLIVTNKVLEGVLRALVTFEAHQFLSILALAFGGFHAFILLGDRYIGFGLADVLIPFRSPYRPMWVGLGVLAFYLTAIVTLSFYIKKRIGHRAWRLLHYTSFAGWVMVTLHSLLAGSDSQTPLMSLVYVITTLSIGFLTIYRVLVARSSRARAAQSLPG